MYLNGSDLFNQTIRQPVKSYRARLTCGDEVVDNGFVSATLTTGSTTNNCYQLGATVSAQLDVLVSDTITRFIDKWWTYELGIKIDNEKSYDDMTAYEFIPMGVYKVKEQSKSNGKRQFTAYDKLSELNVMFDFGAEEFTSHEIIDIVAIQCDVTIDKTNVANDVLQNQSGFTCKDILGAIAMLNGCSVYADRYGIIVFKPYTHVETNYTASDTRGFSADEQVFSFTCIAGVTGGVIIGENSQNEVRLLPTYADTSGNTLLFYNPFFTQELLDRLYGSINVWNYNVANVPLALGDIRIDPWDVINVFDNQNEEYIIPCMALSHAYSGGLTTNIQSFGEEQGNTEEGYISPYKRLQNAITTALLTVEKLVANMAQIAGFMIDEHGLETTYQQYETSKLQRIRINSGSDDDGQIAPALIQIDNPDEGILASFDGDHLWICGDGNPILGENVNCVIEPNRVGIAVYNGSKPNSGIVSGVHISRLTPDFIEEKGQKLEDKYAKKNTSVDISASGISSSYVGNCSSDDSGIVFFGANFTVNSPSSSGTYVLGKIASTPKRITPLTATFNASSGVINRCWIATDGTISVHITTANASANTIRVSGFWFD